MKNRFFYISFIIGLTACNLENSNSNEPTKPTKQDSSSKCILELLPKTIEYQKTLNSFAEYKSDTTFILESVSINGTKYETSIAINQNEIMVWMDIETKTGNTRTIEIFEEDYIESIRSASTTFNVKDCKIIKTEKIENPDDGTIKTNIDETYL